MSLGGRNEQDLGRIEGEEFGMDMIKTHCTHEILKECIKNKRMIESFHAERKSWSYLPQGRQITISLLSTVRRIHIFSFHSFSDL